MFELHDFSLSVASYRVRIGLRLKSIAYETIPVSLIRKGGEHHMVQYRSLNPQGLIPTFTDHDTTLSQSLAILEYLDEIQPDPPLLPRDPLSRARARQIAQIMVCDIQPLLNLRVLGYLRSVLGIDEAGRSQWFKHWLLDGLDALEIWLSAELPNSRFAVGNSVSLADVCLVPQLFAARRFKLPLDDFPRLCEIEKACFEIEAFQQARPQKTSARR